MKLKKFALVFFVPLGVAITGVSVLSSKSRVIRAEDVARLEMAAWLRYEVVQLEGTNVPSLPTPEYNIVPVIDTNLISDLAVTHERLEKSAIRAGLMPRMTQPMWMVDQSVSSLESGDAIVTVNRQSPIVSEVVSTDEEGDVTSRNRYWDFGDSYTNLYVEQIPAYGTRCSSNFLFRGFLGLTEDNRRLLTVYPGTQENVPFADALGFSGQAIPSYGVHSVWPASCGKIDYCFTNFAYIDATNFIHTPRVIRKDTLSQISDALTNVSYTLYSCHVSQVFTNWYLQEGSTDTNFFQSGVKSVNDFKSFTAFSNFQSSTTNDYSGMLSQDYSIYFDSLEVLYGPEYATDDGSTSKFCQQLLQSFTRQCPMESGILPYPSVWAVTNGLVDSISVLIVPQYNILSGTALPDGSQYSGDQFTNVFLTVYHLSDLPNYVSCLTSPIMCSEEQVDRAVIQANVSVYKNYVSDQGRSAKKILEIDHPRFSDSLVVSSDLFRNLLPDTMTLPSSNPDKYEYKHYSSAHPDELVINVAHSLFKFSYSLDYSQMIILVKWVNPFDWIDSHVSTNSVSP